MGIERRLKRKQKQDVKKMYEKQMRKMATMTDEQRITHLAHLSRNLPIKEQNKIEVLNPIDIDGI
jgi:hypothetical protein